jgi:hypothetical protein
VVGQTDGMRSRTGLQEGAGASMVSTWPGSPMHLSRGSSTATGDESLVAERSSWADPAWGGRKESAQAPYLGHPLPLPAAAEQSVNT